HGLAELLVIAQDLRVVVDPDPACVAEQVVLGEGEEGRGGHRPEDEGDEPQEPREQEEVAGECRRASPAGPPAGSPRQAGVASGGGLRLGLRAPRRVTGRADPGAHAKPSAVVKNCSTASGIDVSPKAMASLRSSMRMRSSANPAGQSR